MKTSRISSTALAGLLVSLLAACATVPLDFPRQYSETIQDTLDTPLGKVTELWVDSEHGLSGYYPLVNGLDALGIRLAMIDRAGRSIDAQYFLMKPDNAGRLFADKLLEAADRGVRVRLLLDDVFTTVNDDAFIVMSQHANIEIRLFNPVARKGFYYFNYLGDFKRANRRMHNKSFTVDNAFTVVGGRNIAAEYFEILDDEKFEDFDVLAIGPVASEVSVIFDRYWNHELTVPIEAFDNGKDSIELEEARRRFDQRADEAGNSIYGRALTTPLMQEMTEGKIKLYVGPGEVVTDDPDKLLTGISQDQQLLAIKLLELVESAEKEIVITTPYFIPGKKGVELWRKIVAKGVRVVILTNSLASNNHTAVHSAYARYRREIIEAGVELYETRVDAANQATNPDDKTYDSMTLHAKGMAIDQRYTVAGSLNLDPRSIEINTEFGLVIDNSEMAALLVNQLLESLPTKAYRVTINDKNKLRWTTYDQGVAVIEAHEPQTSRWMRFKAWILRIAPESQL